MNNKISNVLKKFIDNKYEAYVVGGYVRDFYLGNKTYDVDIATIARPKDIITLFDLSSSNEDNYGSISLKDSIYNYDITTYRKEISYENRKPNNIEYITDIKEDAKRRDFTINALYMDIDGKIIDYYDGIKDLENKVIRLIGSKERLIEDPLRILRAVRFSSTLNFTIEESLFNYIRQNKELLRTLSYTRKKEELSKIFKSNNRMKGINTLIELGLDKELEIEFKENLVDVFDELGIWAQMSFSNNYPFKKQDKEKIENIKKILDYGIIDNIVLYQYGLYLSIIAGTILGYETSYISLIYKGMPIYSAKDIDITGDEIMSLLNIDASLKIKNIISDLEINILNNELINTKDEISKYLLENWRS